MRKFFTPLSFFSFLTSINFGLKLKLWLMVGKRKQSEVGMVKKIFLDPNGFLNPHMRVFPGPYITSSSFVFQRNTEKHNSVSSKRQFGGKW